MRLVSFALLAFAVLVGTARAQENTARPAIGRVQSAGTNLPRQSTINFIGATVVDNPGALRTDITVGGGGVSLSVPNSWTAPQTFSNIVMQDVASPTADLISLKAFGGTNYFYVDSRTGGGPTIALGDQTLAVNGYIAIDGPDILLQVGGAAINIQSTVSAGGDGANIILQASGGAIQIDGLGILFGSYNVRAAHMGPNEVHQYTLPNSATASRFILDTGAAFNSSVSITDQSGTTAVLDMTNGEGASVCAGSHGCFRYNVTTQHFEMSQNGLAWVQVCPVTVAEVSDAAISQFALVKGSTTAGRVVTLGAADASNLMVGVAQAAVGGAGSSLLVQELQGASTSMLSDGTTTIAAGDLVQPSTTVAGRVMKGTSSPICTARTAATNVLDTVFTCL